MKPKLAENVRYLYRPLEVNGYPNAIMELDDQFDVIVVDGRLRNQCARHAIRKLSPSGVVIWDNSDRDKYQESYDLLAGNGFKRLDFIGMGPITARSWGTSIFYRPNNILGI